MATPTSAARGACPTWCVHDFSTGIGEVLHELDLPDVWTYINTPGVEVVGLALNRFDDGAGQGSSTVEIRYSRDGLMTDGSVRLVSSAARGFALAVLRLADLADA